MKGLLSFVLLVMVALSGCTSTKNVSANSSIAGVWELNMFPSGGKEFAEIFGQRKPELKFDEVNKKVSGTTGCNHISGQYIHNNAQFQFADNMIMTKMACPGYDEMIFLEALRRVNRYEVRNDQLNLMLNDAVLMTLSKKSSE